MSSIVPCWVPAISKNTITMSYWPANEPSGPERKEIQKVSQGLWSHFSYLPRCRCLVSKRGIVLNSDWYLSLTLCSALTPAPLLRYLFAAISVFHQPVLVRHHSDYQRLLLCFPAAMITSRVIGAGCSRTSTRNTSLKWLDRFWCIVRHVSMQHCLFFWLLGS